MTHLYLLDRALTHDTLKPLAYQWTSSLSLGVPVPHTTLWTWIRRSRWLKFRCLESRRSIFWGGVKHQKNPPLWNMMTHHVNMIIVKTWYIFLWTWNKSSCQPETHIMSTCSWIWYHVYKLHIMSTWSWIRYLVYMICDLWTCWHDMDHVSRRIVSCVNDTYHVDVS